jgi:hypothetical protein
MMRRTAAAVLAALTVLAGGCGVRPQDEPEILPTPPPPTATPSSDQHPSPPAATSAPAPAATPAPSRRPGATATGSD